MGVLLVGQSESSSSGVVIRGGGNQASIGVAHSQGNSDSSQSGSQAAISTLNANNISLVAENDLLIEGANIDALNDIELRAANDISITSAQNNSDSSFNSNSMNAGAGLGVTVGQGGASVGYYVEGGFSKEDLERQSNTHQNANINAGGNLVINSGRDTTVSGAHLEGGDVNINVAGDLSVASLQDTASADGQRSDANLSVTVGYGVSVSGSAGYGETQGNKAWVENQTSIVGRNSVDIDVEGHTQIDGALIANIDENGVDQGNLELTTGSIGFSDIEGVDEESSRYVNVSGGFTSEANSSNSSAGTGPGQRNRGGVDQDGVTSWGVNGYNNERDREQTTRATVGEGNITVTGGEGSGEEQLAELNRDIDNAQEVTRDEKSETNLYVTSSSVDAASSPSETLSNWGDDIDNYSVNTTKTFIDIANLPDELARNPNAIYQAASMVAEGVNEVMNKLGTYTIGAFPSTHHHGGLATQLPTLILGDQQNRRVEVVFKQVRDEITDEPVIDNATGEPVLEIDFEKTTISGDNIDINNLPEDVKHFFVNGILNTMEDAIRNGNMQTGADTLIVAFNPSHGFLGDLLESGLDKTLGAHGIAHSGNAGQVIDLLKAAQDQNITLSGAAHSQGGLLLTTALNWIDEGYLKRDCSNGEFKFQINGAPVDTADFVAAVRDSGGEFSRDENGNIIPHNINPGDPVPLVPILGGGNAENVQEIFDALLNVLNLLNPEISPHSNYRCEGDICGGETNAEP